MIYKYEDGNKTEIQDFEIPKDKNLYFKVNLPETLESYKDGNGEGIWACGDKNTFDAWNNDIENGIYFVKVLNNSVYYPTLKYGTIIPVEMRGDNRPVAIYNELRGKYGECQKEEILSKLRYYHMVEFVINSMLDLWLDKDNEGYSFICDLEHYYEKTIKKDAILEVEEFTDLVRTVLEKREIKKGTLT